MSLKLPLLSRSPINFAAAKNTDDNIIALSKQYHDTLDFYQTLFDKKDAIYDIVRFQLGLDPYRDNCHVSPNQEWMRGKFNVCVPISVNSRQFCGRVLMRFPLPHMFRGEAQNPSGSTSSTGSIDDKYLHELRHPWYLRLLRTFWRYLGNLCRRRTMTTTMTRYIPSHCESSPISMPYLLLEYIDPNIGSMLSDI
ncbi:hypothetical protein BB8028_0008g00120 [Beauveria bassiana]|uniref:Uncharacterized protein n=1 Tax=Beauveria bassiana TaxID=176275 RepID=A0A2S7YMT7_BEABA|nr:hypothetical protein BB8028_0008g00120 [Beauveria bassiana]